MSEQKAGEGHRAPGPRRLAEWLSFGVSLAMVLALVAHLAWRMRSSASEAVATRITARLDQVTQEQGRYVLPLEVINSGARTLRELQIRIEYRARSGAREQIDLLIDYLGQGSQQIVYAYFGEDPRSLSVHADPISYRVD